MKKILAFLLTVVMALSLVACGGGDETPTPSNDPGSTTTQPSTPDASTPAEGQQTAGGYTYRTRESNRVVTENGTFTKDQITAPTLITSIGQSADASMVDALMKKAGAEDYTFNATATADEVAECKTLILVVGASSKGLGAAGISEDQESERADEIINAVKDNDITVIVAHLGGSSRRGALSDKFNNMGLGVADYILVVEDGNVKDSLFTNAATEAGVPITLLYSIADALTPLTELYGA